MRASIVSVGRRGPGWWLCFSGDSLSWSLSYYWRVRILEDVGPHLLQPVGLRCWMWVSLLLVQMSQYLLLPGHLSEINARAGRTYRRREAARGDLLREGPVLLPPVRPEHPGLAPGPDVWGWTCCPSPCLGLTFSLGFFGFS